MAYMTLEFVLKNNPANLGIKAMVKVTTPPTPEYPSTKEVSYFFDDIQEANNFSNAKLQAGIDCEIDTHAVGILDSLQQMKRDLLV